MELSEAVIAISKEYRRARTELKYEGFYSYHEGISIIREEFEELWDEIKDQKEFQSKVKIRKEAVQLGAMVLAFLVELIE